MIPYASVRSPRSTLGNAKTEGADVFGVTGEREVLVASALASVVKVQ